MNHLKNDCEMKLQENLKKVQDLEVKVSELNSNSVLIQFHELGEYMYIYDYIYYIIIYNV